MSEFQFGLADLFCATIAVSLAIGWLLGLSNSSSDHWLIVALTLICAGIGIAFSHIVYSDARFRGGTGTAIWTTLLGVVMGIAGAPIILIALPLAILLGLIVVILLGLEFALQRLSRRLAILFKMTKKPDPAIEKPPSPTSP